MGKATLRFEREKETKNSVRFQEAEQPGKPKAIGMLYVQKWFAGDAAVLTVTVETGAIGLK